MLIKVIFFSTLIWCAFAQEATEEAHPAPEPYSFTFESPNEDGSSSARQETGDAQGRITGFYIIKGLDGQDRRVDYTADENGFHAEVSTNEIGTETHEASNAIYRSSAPPLAELMAQWESSGAAAAAAERRKTQTATVRTSILTETKPVVNVNKVETVRKTEVTSGAQVTPEGYVLVPVSAARSAGIQTIGPEISDIRNYAPGGVRVETKPLTTTTSTTRTRVVGSTRLVNVGPSNLQAGVVEADALETLKPESSSPRFSYRRNK